MVEPQNSCSPSHMQRRSAGDQHVELGTDEPVALPPQAAAPHHLLKVVQQQQHLFLSQRVRSAGRAALGLRPL